MQPVITIYDTLHQVTHWHYRHHHHHHQHQHWAWNKISCPASRQSLGDRCSNTRSHCSHTCAGSHDPEHKHQYLEEVMNVAQLYFIQKRIFIIKCSLLFIISCFWDVKMIDFLTKHFPSEAPPPNPWMCVGKAPQLFTLIRIKSYQEEMAWKNIIQCHFCVTY